MKNISLILNGVLLVAVVVLYYLHFSSNSPSQAAVSPTPNDLKFAYINSDSVLKHYEYFKVNRTKLEAKGKKLDQDLRNRAQSLQNDFEAYQRNLSNLTIGQAKAIEEDLGKKQQNLELYRQSLEQEMLTEQSKMNTDLYAKVTQFLKKYGQENGLQVVLKFDPSSDLLFGGDSLDITTPVVNGLNEAYKTEAAGEVKKDSITRK